MPDPRPSPSAKWIYLFGTGRSDGRGDMADLLGGKGAHLAEMARLGLAVPPGFTITTEVCRLYQSDGRLPAGLEPQVMAALVEVEQAVGRVFGDVRKPLLVSVRSGARVSMPGMMDTVLNLGLNDATVAGLAERSGDARFAYDSYRRFILMYATVVLGMDHRPFEDSLDSIKSLKGFATDAELGAEQWRDMVGLYQDAIRREHGQPFPQDPNEQLWDAIAAVLDSWQSKRAVEYRRLHGIPNEGGTAVTVQTMVFGNRGERSATGVAFTRNPSTGAKGLYGEYLPNAQGEDVVAGIRTPHPLTAEETAGAGLSLEAAMPDIFAELKAVLSGLEAHYRDMQDTEFTVEDGKLWMLQTRTGKRTTAAALKIAVDLCAEGIMTREEAVMRIDVTGLDQLLHPTIAPNAHKQPIARGLPASPGAAAGEIVFDPDHARALKSEGRTVILVRVETSPEDIHGMHAAAGILTSRGGMTSHAAVVARHMGRPCVTGAGALRIDVKGGTMTAAGRVFGQGEIVTIDGSTGEVLLGRVEMRQPELSGDFAELMSWADAVRRLRVRANADTARDARTARTFGAEGIGLCRTEHMFFEADRILAMREMICAGDESGRRRALAKILPMQRRDFEELFEIMAGLPVTIRLIDPPLHEFLPHEEKEAAAVAAALGLPLDKVKTHVDGLAEVNPMLGFRGCRVAIRYPEICEMQARAIFEAAAAAGRKTGRPVTPEVMIPLVAYRKEFDILRDVIVRTAAAVEAETGTELGYQVGTMIELPRAALQAGEIAAGSTGAEFFSFGTNDLTQTCLGLSRDDAAPILADYAERNIFAADPFVSIDRDGVGELMRIAAERGRTARPSIKIGICGEHGGDPPSVAFCHAVGLDYVSCSPFRVPAARLAAAQAAIGGQRTGDR
ncbi:MAG: pyruvate, phosphate dikinase [Hyphomicrobiaceae bacterium]